MTPSPCPGYCGAPRGGRHWQHAPRSPPLPANPGLRTTERHLWAGPHLPSLAPGAPHPKLGETSPSWDHSWPAGWLGGTAKVCGRGQPSPPRPVSVPPALAVQPHSPRPVSATAHGHHLTHRMPPVPVALPCVVSRLLPGAGSAPSPLVYSLPGRFFADF